MRTEGRSLTIASRTRESRNGANGRVHGQCVYLANLMGISLSLRVFLQVQYRTLTHLARGGRVSWKQVARFLEHGEFAK